MKTNFASWIEKYSFLLFAIQVLLVALFVLSLTSYALKFNVDVDEVLNTDARSIKDLQAIEKIGRPKVLSVFFETKNSMCPLRDVVLELLDQPYIKNVVSILDLEKAHYDRQKLIYVPLLDKDCKKWSFSTIKNSPWANVLALESGSIIHVEFVEADTIYGNFDKIHFEHAKALIEKYRPQFESIYFGGDSSRKYAFLEVIESKHLLNVLIVSIIVLMFYIFFKTITSSLILMVSVMFTNLATMALAASQGISLDALLASIFLMILIFSVEDFIYLTYKSARVGLKQALSELALPSFLTSLTTFVGFGSLVFSENVLLQNFGFLVSFAALTEWLALFVFVPAVLFCFRPNFVWWTTPRPILSVSLNMNYLQNIWVRSVFVLIFIGGMIVIPFFKVLDTPENFIPKNHWANSSLAELNRFFGWKGVGFIIFESEVLPNEYERLRNQLAKIDKISQIRSYEDYVEGISADVKSELARDLIHREVQISWFGKQFYLDSGERISEIYLPSFDSDYLLSLNEQVKNTCQEKCRLAGSIAAFIDFNGQIIPTLKKSIFSSLFLVVCLLFLFVLYRARGRLSWVPIFASLWGWGAALLIFYSMGFHYSFLSCVFLSVLISLAGDNVIQFLFSKNSKIGTGAFELFGPSLMVMLTMVPGALVFMLSPLKYDQDLGFMLAIAFFLNLVGDFFVLVSFVDTPKKAVLQF